MLLVTFAALGFAAVQADARPAIAYRTDQVSAGLKAGCKVQAVHTPAGKIGSQRAIVRCPVAVKEIEAEVAPKSLRAG